MSRGREAAPRPVTLPPPLPWQIEFADALVAGGASVAAVVPDSRLDGIVSHAGASGLTVRTLAREEACVAYAAGQRITGMRPVVLMQCSGIGNALNALGSLAIPYGLGIPLVLSMRGTLGESNPAQVPMGRATPALLAALGIQAFWLRDARELERVVRGALTLAYDAEATAAILLGPELEGGRERG